MTIKEVFEKLNLQCHENVLFSFFYNEFCEGIETQAPPPPATWKETSLGPRNTIAFYDRAINLLFQLANRLAHENDNTPYEEATALALFLRQILMEGAEGIELDEAQIVSYTDMMVAEGLIEIVPGKESDSCVRLTAKGEATAKEAEKTPSILGLAMQFLRKTAFSENQAPDATLN